MQSNHTKQQKHMASHVQGVNATGGGLLKATLAAASIAAGILTLVWLPAEYGIDPTGVGSRLGLTEMGKIKQQLNAEAAADAVNTQSNQASGIPTADTNITHRLDAIEKQLAAIVATKPTAMVATEEAPTTPELVATEEALPAWRDEVEYTLEPTKGIEIKLVMEADATADFEWTANGAVLNYDTHGDGKGKSISYEKGRSVPGQAGQLTAAFTGNHGWFWRNRTDNPVLMTLRTRGDYERLVLP